MLYTVAETVTFFSITYSKLCARVDTCSASTVTHVGPLFGVDTRHSGRMPTTLRSRQLLRRSNNKKNACVT